MDLDNKASDTLSEISDVGTARTSISGQGSSLYGGNYEILQDLSVALGLSSVEDLHEERFRVDRRKLEQLISGGDEDMEPAETFFQKIMDETSTYIMWPSRLKIGAKSRKDPHVRIAGRHDDVKSAKEKVMEILDTRSNRVTMKLDVSYTDHSHIIGKGGLTIKRVMEETGCHIHFPDSNRSNVKEKSNQVSIAGKLEGVEQARARVRNLTPLIFSFELPVVTLQSLPDNNSPYLRSIQDKYNVQIMFRNRPKLYGTVVIVKGCEWEVAKVKEATLLVIHHMCDSLATQVQVQMTLEISPQHHSVVLGRNSSNLRLIMEQTSTQIMFPDAGDPNIPALRKSNICITGAINNVYLARQQLMGSLPIVLMFDLSEDMAVDIDQVPKLMQKLDVFISIRHKPKQNVLSVIIKGVERNTSNMYTARNELLGFDEPWVVAEIPASYFMPNTPPVPNAANDVFGSNNPGRCQVHGHLAVNTNCIGLPAINLPTLQGAITPPFPSPVGSIGNPWGGGYTPPTPVSMTPFLHSPLVPQPSMNHLLNLQPHMVMHHVGNGGVVTSSVTPSNGSSCNVSRSGSTSSGYSSRNQTHGNFSNSFLSLPSDPKDNNVFSSLSSNTSSLSSPAMSPQNGSSPVQKNGVPADSTNMNDLCNMMTDLMSSDRRAPGCEKKTLELAQHSLNTFDFDKKKLRGYQAMQKKPVPGDVRVPTSTWSGYGLSHSSPAPELEHWKRESFAASLLDEASGSDETTNRSLAASPSMFPTTSSDFNNMPCLSASNYLDSTPTSTVKRITGLETTDMVTLLTTLGLDKYIAVFQSHEIDLQTFATLSDADLREIGVNALGARRKLLLTISELNKRHDQFGFSAAPGAERKVSSTVRRKAT